MTKRTVALVLSVLSLIVLLKARDFFVARSARQFADDTILAVVDGWHYQPIVDRASPAWWSELQREGGVYVFRQWQSLGKLLKYQPARGTAQRYRIPGQGVVASGSFQAIGTFEHGRAQITVWVVRNDGDDWRLQSFVLLAKIDLPPAEPDDRPAYWPVLSYRDVRN